MKCPFKNALLSTSNQTGGVLLIDFIFFRHLILHSTTLINCLISRRAGADAVLMEFISHLVCCSNSPLFIDQFFINLTLCSAVYWLSSSVSEFLLLRSPKLLLSINSARKKERQFEIPNLKKQKKYYIYSVIEAFIWRMKQANSEQQREEWKLSNWHSRVVVVFWLHKNMKLLWFSIVLSGFINCYYRVHFS